MTNLRFGKKNEAWVDAHPRLAVAAANLRGQAGMSEERIIKAMRREVNAESVPSYGDLRAAFARYKAGHQTFEGRTGLRFGPEHVTNKAEGPHAKVPFDKWGITEGHSAYRERIEEQFSQRQQDKLDNMTAMGYLISAETPAEEFRDPDAYLDWDQDRGYDTTPPF